jgi:hypothetical protein
LGEEIVVTIRRNHIKLGGAIERIGNGQDDDGEFANPFKTLLGGFLRLSAFGYLLGLARAVGVLAKAVVATRAVIPAIAIVAIAFAVKAVIAAMTIEPAATIVAIAIAIPAMSRSGASSDTTYQERQTCESSSANMTNRHDEVPWVVVGSDSPEEQGVER